MCVVWMRELIIFISTFLKFNNKTKNQHLDILSSAVNLWKQTIVMDFANDVYEIKNYNVIHTLVANQNYIF